MGIAEQNRVIVQPKRQLAALGWLCAALLLILFVWRTVLPATQQKTYAFSVYYTAARLTIQGQAGVGFCSEWFFDQQRSLGFGERADYFCPNPPTNALVLLPVAWLPPRPAQAAWIVCDLVMLGGIVALGWRMVVLARCEPVPSVEASPSQPYTARRWTNVPSWQPGVLWLKTRFSAIVQAVTRDRAFAAVQFALSTALIIALFRPLHAELHAVQVYTLIALLYALWLYGYLTRRDWLCGVALALLVLTKLSGWPLWLLMLAARRWRALAWALGVGVAIGLAMLPWLTFAFWRLYLFEQVPAISLNPTHAVPANQTLTSLLRQCFTYDPEWAPRPLIDAPWLANVIWWLVALALLAPTLVYAYRHERMARQETGDGRQETGDGRQETGDAGLWSLVSGLWSPTLRPSTTRFAIDRFALAMLCLVVPLQPAGEEYHYTLLLIVLLVVCNRPVLASLGSRTAAVGLALAWLLLALPSYFLQTAHWQGWPIALLAYPRVYGALLLWGILVRIEDRGWRIEDSTMLQ
jgi:hypothetical protein